MGLILVDTREHQKERERICQQFDKLGVEYERRKLNVGDYMDTDNPHVVIERKKDLHEICGNVTYDHERFRRELIRARENDVKIILLCEHGKDIETLEDVFFWENPRSKPSRWVMRDGHPCKVPASRKAVTGRQLYKSLNTISERYGIEIYFCEKSETGKRIIELLEKYNGEH